MPFSNEPYSKVIGSKHPRILGMPYDEAWPEVWEGLGPVVKSAYSGSVVHVDDQEMFLNRGDLLEETFFSWSMIPLRSSSGHVEGVSAGQRPLRRISRLKGTKNHSFLSPTLTVPTPSSQIVD
jgi:hypothetical protein